MHVQYLFYEPQLKQLVGRELTNAHIIIGFLAVGFVLFGTGASKTLAADPAAGSTVPSAGAAVPAPARATMSPSDRVASTPKGQLKNPYTDFAGMTDEGHKIFMGAGCNGCHGGGGGGGMCPPLTNDVWLYGRDDDTLFRLITLGTDGLHKQGYVRHGSEIRCRSDAAIRSNPQIRR